MGSFGTVLGAWIKVFGVGPDRFNIALLGQTVVAMSQVFILGVPPNVAAVWFGPEQVSSACSIGVFGNQVCAISSRVSGTCCLLCHHHVAWRSARIRASSVACQGPRGPEPNWGRFEFDVLRHRRRLYCTFSSCCSRLVASFQGTFQLLWFIDLIGGASST